MNLLLTGSPGQWRDREGGWRANRSQFSAHVEPLATVPEVTAVYVVADAEVPSLPKMRCYVPPRPLSLVLGRALAKLVVCAAVAAARRPSWIVTFGLVPHALSGALVARATGARTMVHLLSGTAEWRSGGWQSRNRVLGRIGRPLPFLERRFLRLLDRSDVVVAMGSGAASELRAAGVTSGVAVRPGSVDPSRFPPATDDPVEYDIVAITRLAPHKRVQDLLVAVALLRSAFPSVRAAIAGDGPQREALEALAARLGIGEAVDFLGFVDDVAALHRRSRIFVLTSETEGVSIAVAEAMMSGLPVVATVAGDTEDLVTDGLTGFLVPIGNPHALASRLAELLASDATRRRVGKRARATVLERFGVAAACDHYRLLLTAEPTSMRDDLRPPARHATSAVSR